MERNNSITALVQCIEVVISKCRASLTVKEIEMLEDVIHLLHELDQKEQRKDQQMLVLILLLRISGFLLNPEVIEKIKNLIHQLL